MLTKVLNPYIMVDELARSLVEMALTEHEKQTWTNPDLVDLGKSLLTK